MLEPAPVPELEERGFVEASHTVVAAVASAEDAVEDDEVHPILVLKEFRQYRRLHRAQTGLIGIADQEAA